MFIIRRAKDRAYAFKVGVEGAGPRLVAQVEESQLPPDDFHPAEIFGQRVNGEVARIALFLRISAI